MIVDAQTFRDLEIFESESGARSLFDFCNRTRTTGGAKALRRRMQRPWSNSDRIHSTQKAISYILSHRSVFDGMPVIEHTTNRVERYVSDLLELIMHENALEFGIGVLHIRINRGGDYTRIVRGVQITARLIHALRSFVAQDVFCSALGELGSIVDEIRRLLARPRLVAVPDKDPDEWGAWQILRIDQVFRLHEKSAIRRLLQLMYETDALVALADVTGDPGLLLPQVEEGRLRVHAEGLVHPLVENAVPNAVDLNQEKRLLFLTGPNMAGKTTYLRTFATALYMAHLGMGVSARRFSFVPVERLFSSIAHSEDLRGGISYFRAEALRVKLIAESLAAGRRVVAVLDEPFKGTNVKDALDASSAILQRLAVREGCLFMFSSHLIELRRQLDDSAHVDCHYFEADEGGERLRLTYVLQSGVSTQRLGMRLLEEEGIFHLLDDVAV